MASRRTTSDGAATKTSAAAEVAEFNQRYPVGIQGRLRKDSGEIVDTTVRHQAYVSHSGYPVAFFTGVSGYYLVDRFST
jgi:hypothetical protein